MKFKQLMALSLLNLAFTFSSQAALITVASDDANNYGNQWLGNGGTGFDQWSFITDSASGSAGGFLANVSSAGNLNNIASNPSDNAWGSYANGNGFNQFEAYRGFSSNSLEQVGDVFQLSFEHGGITIGGSVGFVLRNDNIAGAIGDYNAESRFEFGFVGGGSNYMIYDGSGVTDTGIGYTNAGLDLTFTLLTADLYQLDIYSAVDNSLLQSRNGNLSGSGSIDSVALYNRDAGTDNAYFNSMSISYASTVSVPEPSTCWLFCLAAVTVLVTNRRKLNS
ncbi:MAG: PEP-CTERM sorting domain-containing protein [Colwellia sp.]|nr:PEP-CTERM sorting domain-containing protein [Colwellia sp.]